MKQRESGWMVNWGKNREQQRESGWTVNWRKSRGEGGGERAQMDIELEENCKNLYMCILCVANRKSICRFSPKCHTPWEEPFNSPPYKLTLHITGYSSALICNKWYLFNIMCHMN